MVEPMRALSAAAVLEQFVTTNDGFLGTLADLDDAGWSMVAESPPGHVSIRLLAFHALWDTWIHERDIALPLGITPPFEADEVVSSVRYAAALSPAILINAGVATRGVFGVDMPDVDTRFTVDVGDFVAVREAAPPVGAPCLCGSSVELAEALSIRLPLPASTPPEWHELVEGLQNLFDVAAPVR
jgi:hypothetical protein